MKELVIIFFIPVILQFLFCHAKSLPVKLSPLILTILIPALLPKGGGNEWASYAEPFEFMIRGGIIAIGLLLGYGIYKLFQPRKGNDK